VRSEFTTTVSINSDGFRGPELHEVGEPRVLVLGDSFTFGHGVNDKEAYPWLLDSLLVGVEVINAGFTAGSSPDMYYAWLANGRPPVLDAIIIGFFVGNDIDRHSEMAWETVDPWGLPTRIVNTESEVVDHYLRSRTVPIGYRFPVLRESHVFHLAGAAFRRMQGIIRRPPHPAPSVFDAPWRSGTWTEVRKTMQAFDGIARASAERGVPVAVVMIPTLRQVRGQDPMTVQEVFAAFFAERRIPALDLATTLLGREDAYFEQDQHWNALGHRLAAATIAAWYATSK
jgi:hypothetical protein